MLLAVIPLMAACSTTPTPTTPAANAAAMSSPASASPTTPTALDAAGVVTKLKAARLPVGAVTVYTAANDPNHLLGRPNGYTSKAAFIDTRVKPSDARDTSAGSVDLGGSVEVFATGAEATAREQYIQGAEKSMPMLGTEYDYVSGDVLLRVSEVLTPDQAKAYQAALAD